MLGTRALGEPGPSCTPATVEFSDDDEVGQFSGGKGARGRLLEDATLIRLERAHDGIARAGRCFRRLAFHGRGHVDPLRVGSS